ncbi:MAG TPA: peptidoglycan-associated lipoprotein Pal [Caulobacteraceae bacterium]
MSFDLRHTTRLAALAVAAAALAACSTPKPPPPAPVSGPPPAAPAPERPRAPPVAQAPTGPVPGSIQDFVVNVGDRIYFDYDKYDVRADAQPVLSAQATWLAKYPSVKVRIEGNADERGTREYNLALGSRRANSIKDFLTSHGVAADRIETISYGKEMPIDAGNNEEAFAKNRNGHTAITSGAR